MKTTAGSGDRLLEDSKRSAEMVPNAMARQRPRRQPAGYHLARRLPFRQQTYQVSLCVEADRVARNEHDLVD